MKNKERIPVASAQRVVKKKERIITLALAILLLASLALNFYQYRKTEVINMQSDILQENAEKTAKEYEELAKERDSLFDVSKNLTTGEKQVLENKPKYITLKTKKDEKIKQIKNYNTSSLQYYLYEVYSSN